MTNYLQHVKSLAARFTNFTFQQVPREENSEADALANLGSSCRSMLNQSIPIIHVLHPAISTEEVNQLDEGNQHEDQPQDAEIISDDSTSWVQPIIKFLQDGTVPQDVKNPRAFRIKHSRFVLIDNVLFRKSFSGPYLRCLEPTQAKLALKELHEGDCGNHSGGKSLSSKALRTGYYWPTMRQDAAKYVQKCDACQRHSNILHQPAEFLHPILSSWPFMQWGMDVVGKFPKAPGGKVFMLTMTDYFSKWIEAEAFVQIRDKEVISFLKRNIISRFGVPSEIICDNGSQFISKKTQDFCAKWGIKLITAAPVHPQANGQAESSNKLIVNNLKKRLDQKKGRWAEELPLVLWADRTTPKSATGQTPFSLVFGTEAVIPVEFSIPTARFGLVTPEDNQVVLAEDLDTIDELRDLAKIRMAAYQQRVAKCYNKNVRVRRFQAGDMVLRKVFQNTRELNAGKLAAKWEGPYLVDAEAGKGAYWLSTLHGVRLPRSWNAIHLKAYYM